MRHHPLKMLLLAAGLAGPLTAQAAADGATISEPFRIIPMGPAHAGSNADVWMRTYVIQHTLRHDETVMQAENAELDALRENAINEAGVLVQSVTTLDDNEFHKKTQILAGGQVSFEKISRQYTFFDHGNTTIVQITATAIVNRRNFMRAMQKQELDVAADRAQLKAISETEEENRVREIRIQAAMIHGDQSPAIATGQLADALNDHRNTINTQIQASGSQYDRQDVHRLAMLGENRKTLESSSDTLSLDEYETSSSSRYRAATRLLSEMLGGVALNDMIRQDVHVVPDGESWLVTWDYSNIVSHFMNQFGGVLDGCTWEIAAAPGRQMSIGNGLVFAEGRQAMSNDAVQRLALLRFPEKVSLVFGGWSDGWGGTNPDPHATVLRDMARGYDGHDNPIIKVCGKARISTPANIGVAPGSQPQVAICVKISDVMDRRYGGVNDSACGYVDDAGLPSRLIREVHRKDMQFLGLGLPVIGDADAGLLRFHGWDKPDMNAMLHP